MEDFAFSESEFNMRDKNHRLRSLYSVSIETIVKKYKFLHEEFYMFPPNIYFDILNGLYHHWFVTELSNELTNYKNFLKVLKVPSRRLQLHKCFQAVMDASFHSGSKRPSFILAEEFIRMCNGQRTLEFADKIINQGFNLSSFLSEAGWLEEAESVLLHCRTILLQSESPSSCRKLLECNHRLLHVQNGYCKFKSSEKTYHEALELIQKLQNAGDRSNFSLLFSEFSNYFMLHSDYTEAYHWSLKSLKELVPNMHHTALIDIYRQTSKCCVLKREFKKAGLLIKEACKLSRQMKEDQALKYADTLMDFGFYLLNVDAITQGTEVYQLALHVRQSVFGIGSKNLHLATAHEDLSYASYVFNYSSGLFETARNQVEKAISLLNCLLPSDHLLLSSCKRVKALILEEMAIENTDKEIEAKYLDEAHNLHNEALSLSLKAFGEMNVQTAKHYGNLGRLYQSMKKFKKAEEMHLKAIDIKETLLGPNDYEVALSVGHLASLYNYDLGYYSKAEMLYLRSIEIGKKLFGEAYSSLEYDYRGLLRVYANQCDMEKRLRYMNILSCWKVMREQMEEIAESPFSDLNEPLSVELVIQEYMSL